MRSLSMRTPGEHPGGWRSSSSSSPVLLLTCHFPQCRDAEEAAHARDGYEFFGSRLRVELARGGNPRGPPSGGRGGGRFGGGPPRGAGSGYRVLVRGLPPSASWQDLKVMIPLKPTASCSSGWS